MRVCFQSLLPPLLASGLLTARHLRRPSPQPSLVQQPLPRLQPPCRLGQALIPVLQGVLGVQGPEAHQRTPHRCSFLFPEF